MEKTNSNNNANKKKNDEKLSWANSFGGEKFLLQYNNNGQAAVNIYITLHIKNEIIQLWIVAKTKATSAIIVDKKFEREKTIFVIKLKKEIQFIFAAECDNIAFLHPRGQSLERMKNRY